MKTTLDSLHQDHINYARLLALLGADINALKHDDDPDFLRLYDLMKYLSTFPDLHHHKDEEIIFDYVKQRYPDIEEAVNKLTREHGQLAETGAALRETLERVTNRDIVPRDQVIRQAEDYHALLTTHMNNEEAEIFPAIREHLGPADWDAIEKQIETVQDPLFGDVVDQQFASLYERIIG